MTYTVTVIGDKATTLTCKCKVHGVPGPLLAAAEAKKAVRQLIEDRCLPAQKVLTVTKVEAEQVEVRVDVYDHTYEAQVNAAETEATS
jgi:hypothetical protein